MVHLNRPPSRPSIPVFTLSQSVRTSLRTTLPSPAHLLSQRPSPRFFPIRRRYVFCCSPPKNSAPPAPTPASSPVPTLPTPTSPPRSPIPTEVALLLSGGLIGGGVGICVTAFKLSISRLGNFLYGDIVAGTLSDALGNMNLVAIPIIGGLAVAGLRAAAGPFFGGLSDCVAEPDAEVRLLRGPAQKTLASVLTLGSGLSLGPEQGAVDIGAIFARLLAQSLKFDGARRDLLLSCGAAAGLSAGFNAPIAGVFFALERLRFGDRIGRGGVDAAVVLLAAAMSSLVAQAGLGSTPAFLPPQYEMLNPLAELPMWVALGLLSGGAAMGFRSLLVAMNDFFNSSRLMAPVPETLKPVLGACFCGVTALYFPEVLFFGYETLSALLANNEYFTLPVLLRLLLIKPLCTAICLGSGLVGGTVAPSLFLGALVGASFQKVSAVGFGAINATTIAIHSPFPVLVVAGSPAYALLGMAAVLGGILRAPLTSSLLLFELTRDYKICAASMVCAGIASAVANYSSSTETESSSDSITSAFSSESANDFPEGEPAMVTGPPKSVLESATFGDERSHPRNSGPVRTMPAIDGSLADVDKLLQLGLPFITPSDAILATMNVQDPRVTLRDPLYIRASEPLSAVVPRLLNSSHGAAIITDSSDVLVGLLTIDRAVSVLTTIAADDKTAQSCGSVCENDCVTVTVASTAAQGREKVRRHGSRYAVVLDESEIEEVKAVGIFCADRAERFSARESLRTHMLIKGGS